MSIAHKIEIKPNKEQITLLNKACGCSRFAYNWGLAKWQEMYLAWKGNNQLPRPNDKLIKKEFNKIKEEKFPWIYESPKDANQQAFANLGKAFKRFFKKTSKYPKKKKKKTQESFYVSNDQFKVKGKVLTLPLIGKVKMTEELRFEGKILNAVVSKQAGKWFISICIDKEIKKEPKFKNKVVGIDLGLNSFAALSTENGEELVKAPKPYKAWERKIKRANRLVSRKVKGSNNRKKAVMKLGKVHYKVSCKRKDFLHKLSTRICCENQVICLENLKVQNMMKNHKLAKSIADVGWSEFRQQIEYKAKFYGCEVVIADQWFASSKTCSNCGSKNQDLKLSDRTYNCSICDLNLDRDINAARNLVRVGWATTELTPSGHACLWSGDCIAGLSIVDEVGNHKFILEI